MPNSQAPAHWSKDFVEHLRTVHFALIGISAGLILLVFSSKEYNAATALIQIEEILDLKKIWSFEWIASHTGRHEIYSVPWQEVFASRKWVGEGKPGARVDAALSSDSRFKGVLNSRLPKKRVEFNCLVTNYNWLQREHPPTLVKPDSFPKTLHEYMDWWDDLDRSPFIYVPISLDNQWFFAQEGLTKEPIERVFEKGIENIQSIDIQVHLIYSSVRSPESPSDELALEPDGALYGGKFQRDGQQITILVPVTQFETIIVKQETVHSVFRNLIPGPSNRSFRDLAIAAHDEADLRLETIREFIHDEASKGAEVFEAFGMKFPASQITFWGIALILGVQWYFMIYLRQLFGKLKTDDPGWDVSWIAMDSSVPSKGTLYVTSVLLPCIAAILVAWQATIRLSSGYLERPEHWYHPVHFLAWPWHWYYTVLLKIFALIFAAIASGYLGFLSWKYRPQIAPEPPKPPFCPSQLFE